MINIPAPKIIINRPKKRPNLLTKNKLNEINNSDINNVSETLNLFNDDLKKFSAHYGFNFIDTNSGVEA